MTENNGCFASQCHPEFNSGSRCLDNKRGEMPNQVGSDTLKAQALNKGDFRAPFRSGFTLIELLVVVLIIGILAAVALPQYQQAVNKARAVQALTAVKKFAEAERLYYLEHNSYTTNPYDLDITYPISTAGTHFVLPNGRCNFDYIDAVDGQRAQCTLQSPQIVLQQYLKKNRLDCISYPKDNYRGDKYCEQLTGRTTWYNACSSSSVCHVYSGR